MATRSKRAMPSELPPVSELISQAKKHRSVVKEVRNSCERLAEASLGEVPSESICKLSESDKVCWLFSSVNWNVSTIKWWWVLGFQLQFTHYHAVPSLSPNKRRRLCAIHGLSPPSVLKPSPASESKSCSFPLYSYMSIIFVLIMIVFMAYRKLSWV